MPWKRVLAVAALSLPLMGLGAAAQAIEPGKEYVEVTPAHPTETQGKIEVIEFFWYKCPHCYELEGDLAAWSKALPKDVLLERVPAVFSEKWTPLARVYYSLQALGMVERLHADVFAAIHDQGINLDDPQTFFDWASKHGVDKTRLKATYNSFSVNMKVMRARQLGQDYKLNAVPTFVVNGRYMTAASMTGGQQALFPTLDALIQKERKAGKRN